MRNAPNSYGDETYESGLFRKDSLSAMTPYVAFFRALNAKQRMKSPW